jgi:Uma2 family endonuclease
MAAIYAAAGILVCWIVNLVDRQLEVYTDPERTGYRSRQVLKPGQSVAFVVDGIDCGRVAVDDLMP